MVPPHITAETISLVSKSTIIYKTATNLIQGFLEGAFMYAVLAKIFPIKRAGLQDETDIYGTFSEADAEQKGIQPFMGQKNATLDGIEEVVEPTDFEQVGI